MLYSNFEERFPFVGNHQQAMDVVALNQCIKLNLNHKSDAIAILC